MESRSAHICEQVVQGHCDGANRQQDAHTDGPGPVLYDFPDRPSYYVHLTSRHFKEVNWFGDLAHQVERRVCNAKVIGSSPIFSTIQE